MSLTLFLLHSLIVSTFYQSQPTESADDDASGDEIGNDPNDESTVSNHSSDDDNDNDNEDEDDDSSTSSSTDDEHNDTDISPSLQTHDITALMAKCRAIVSSIRKSSILYERINTLANGSSIKAGPVIDMRVRWNSSYTMLQRMVLYQSILEKLYDAFNSVPGITDTQRKKLFDSKLTGNQCQVVEALRRVLERFDEATKVLSGQKYPTLSLAYAIVFSLLHYLNHRSSDSIKNEIKDMLLDSYNRYMFRDGKEMELIRVSALLDPLTHDLLAPENKRAAESFILKEVMWRKDDFEWRWNIFLFTNIISNRQQAVWFLRTALNR